MKIKLTKALPQPSTGRVIPAGVVLDAPEGFCRRLQMMGYADDPKRKKGGKRPAPKAGRGRGEVSG